VFYYENNRLGNLVVVPGRGNMYKNPNCVVEMQVQSFFASVSIANQCHAP
jgi:hypothetical protein